MTLDDIYEDYIKHNNIANERFDQLEDSKSKHLYGTDARFEAAPTTIALQKSADLHSQLSGLLCQAASVLVDAEIADLTCQHASILNTGNFRQVD